MPEPQFITRFSNSLEVEVRLGFALPTKGVLEKFRAAWRHSGRLFPPWRLRFSLGFSPRYHAYSDGGSVMDPEHRDGGDGMRTQVLWIF